MGKIVFCATLWILLPVRLALGFDVSELNAPLLKDPIWYYSNWSAYDELSDNVELTEDLAMRQLNELVRLRKFGVKLDYYLMDAFWYARDGGYRIWRKPHWPNGPDRWIAACKEIGIEPGLWFASNSVGKFPKLDIAPRWRSSLNEDASAMSFSEGDFLLDFMDVLQFWYDHGIRMFKLDFADFNAASPETKKSRSSAEIRESNKSALLEALKAFRRKNPQSIFLAYNGFTDLPQNLQTESDWRQAFMAEPIDLHWLEVFDSLYSGDAHPSDVPQTSIWRSMDIFSDQQIRYYEQKFVPLERIDNAGFMSGDTNTNLRRMTHAWRGMLILNAARGGWVNTIYGSLQYIDDEKARWFAKVQRLYLPLQATGRTKTFGGVPGTMQPYGFGSLDAVGSVYTMINPAQEIRSLTLPPLSRVQAPLKSGRVIFRDAGFAVELHGDTVTLGPGQMASVGFGRYSSAEFDLGIQEDVIIPRRIWPVTARFERESDHAIETTVAVPEKGDIRVICQQRDSKGNPLTSIGNREAKTHAADLLRIRAEQAGRRVSLETDLGRYIWSGTSWNAGEIRRRDLQPGKPATIHCASPDQAATSLQAYLYAVEY